MYKLYWFTIKFQVMNVTGKVDMGEGGCFYGDGELCISEEDCDL